MFDDFDDLHLQAGGNGLLNIFHRAAAEGRGMDEHGHLGGLLALVVVDEYSARPMHLVGIGGDRQEDIMGALQVAGVKGSRE